MLSHKDKSKLVVESSTLPPVVNLDELPLVDTQYKISETQREFDPYELHNWANQMFLDVSDELSIWESFLPQFIFPQTHVFPEFVTWCHLGYLPSQRVVIA